MKFQTISNDWQTFLCNRTIVPSNQLRKVVTAAIALLSFIILTLALEVLVV